MERGCNYKAEVRKVIDGDTVDLWVDLGFHIWAFQRFRLLGVDAPELRGAEKVEGGEAKTWLKNRLSLASEIEVVSQKTGKYGRWLGTIYADGANVNEQLIQEGHAIRYV